MRHVKVVSNFSEQRVSPAKKVNKVNKNVSFGKDRKEGQSEYRIEKTTGKQIISK